MWRLPVIQVLLLVVSFCFSSKSDAQITTPTKLYSDEIVLFVSPDSTQIKQLEKEFGDDFYTVADDENWYRSEAFTLLDSLGINYGLVNRTPIRFLVDGEEEEYDWKDVETFWFVVLYDGARPPKVSTSVELPSEIVYLRP